MEALPSVFPLSRVKAGDRGQLADIIPTPVVNARDFSIKQRDQWIKPALPKAALDHPPAFGTAIAFERRKTRA
ncbi:MAG TPA: hypothetical protein VHW90_03050 [Stellaceae bacterium]|jgi:hypothetical protein|nr:hypothetical protein [Stellaceae bacterium]